MTSHRLSAFLLAVVSIVGMPAMAPAQLISLFDFDNDTAGSGGIVRDWGIGGNDGSLIATAQITADTPDASSVTRGGQVLLLDGDSDYSRHGSDASLDLTDSMTLAAWVRRDGTKKHTVLAKELDSSLGYFLEVNDGNKVRYFAWGPTPTDFIPAEAIPDNTWTHLAATYDGSNKRVYLDGVEVASSPLAVTGNVTVSPDPFMIGFGKGSANTSNYFRGSIDDVAVFNEALTAAQIGDVMSGDFSGFTTVEPLPTTRIDFGETGHTLAGGFIREEGAQNSGVTSVTVNVPNVFGGAATSLDVTVSELTATPQGLEHRIRTTVTGTGVDDMLEDLIATRDGQLTVTLEDLPPGEYEFTAYHNDSSTGNAGFASESFFDVYLNGNLELSDVAATNEFGAVDLADVGVSNFTFETSALGDVQIEFRGTAANTNGFIPLSGLELAQTPSSAQVPEPSTLLLAAIGLLGLLGWRWRRRR
ncbi:MAG: LamG domain-containing protein [Planctomycetes bacterium]|nr:LamG domain-containing protein [Planctomycetota bacterium]